jgi:hypothetical protein
VVPKNQQKHPPDFAEVIVVISAVPQHIRKLITLKIILLGKAAVYTNICCKSWHYSAYQSLSIKNKDI